MVTFCPIRAFSSVDLPALGGPMRATQPQRWVVCCVMVRLYSQKCGLTLSLTHRPRCIAVFQAIPKDALVFGGRLEPSVLAAAKRQGTRLFDYGEREDFMIANAIPTAEGTLELAMRETESTIRGSETLVLGFGRVARAVAALFHAAGARVRTAARRASDLASIAALGYEAVDIRALHGKLSGCGILVNTAPAPIMTAELLAELPKSCVVIDLASRPGGVDHTAAKQLGLKCVWALSLPGKVAPKAAGDAIWNTVRTMLREVEA